MATRLRLSRLRNFSIERLPAGDDVYLFRARARDNPDDERLFALAEVRDLTRRARRRGPSRRAAPARAGAARGARRHPPIPGAAAAGAPPPLEPRPVVRVAAAPARASSDIEAVARRLAPATDGLGLERIDVRCRRPDPVTWRAPRPRPAHLQPDRHGIRAHRERPADRAAPAARRVHPQGRASPAARHRRTRTRSSTWSRHRGRGGRAEIAGGSFTEYDLDGDRLVPVDRPLRQQHGGDRRRRRPQRHRPIPGGHGAGGPARRPDAARSGRWPSPSAGGSSPPSTWPTSSACPVEWFALSAGRQDRHGQRHREHGLDRRRAAPDHRVHPGAAARSTSSSPASTSAPSRTGTPRRRC